MTGFFRFYFTYPYRCLLGGPLLPCPQGSWAVALDDAVGFHDGVMFENVVVHFD